MDLQVCLTILMVEDDAASAYLFMEQLDDAGGPPLEIVHVQTLEEAHEALAARPFEAMILDLNLPDSRGVDTLKQIRSKTSELPIVVVSGQVDDQLRTDLIVEGADEVLSKDEPFSRLFGRCLLLALSRFKERTQHQNLERILDATPDAILVSNMDGQVLFVNDAALSLFDCRREDFIGELLGFSVRDGASTEVVIRRRGEVTTGEMRVVDLEWQGEPAVLASVRDITERQRVVELEEERDKTRKLAAEALKQSEERLRQLANSMPQIVWSHGPDGRVDYYNERWYEYTGAEGMSSFDSWSRLVHHDDVEMLFAVREAALSSGEPFEVEVRLADKELGHHRWFLVRSVPVHDIDGEVERWFGTCTDIDRRKRAEIELQRHASRVNLLNQVARGVLGRSDLTSIFRVVLHHLEVQWPVHGAVMYLVEGEQVRVVANGKRLAAREPVSPEGAIIDPREAGIVQCLKGEAISIDNVEALEDRHYEFARRRLRSHAAIPLVLDSSILGVLVVQCLEPKAFSAEELRFLKGLAEHVAVAVHESRQHSELKQAYETLQRTQDQIIKQERLRALGQMASGVAHDFNNALALVQGYAELLKDSPPEDLDEATSQRYASLIYTAAKDGARVVGRLREFYRHREAGDLLTSIDLNLVIEETVALTRTRWRDQAQSQGKMISIDLDLKRPQRIAGSASELRELLTNLLFNAVDALPKGPGAITISTRGSSEGVWLELRDTGIGMSEDQRLHCFEPFFTTKGSKGTGLGLSMVHGIVRRHEGRMEVESTIGSGTCFRIWFPNTNTGTQHETKTELEILRPQGLRILVVDDVDEMREMVTAFLARDRHQITEAPNGKEAFEIFEMGAFDLVITDQAMPVMNGDRLAGLIKESSPKTPIILLTGFGDMMRSAKEQVAGVDLVLSKPVTAKSLRQAIQTLTEESEA